MRFEVNETEKGIVNPPKELCKVKGCGRKRLDRKRAHAFCKDHAGLKHQMSKKKFKEFLSNGEWAIVEATKGKSRPCARKGFVALKVAVGVQ